MTSLLRTGTLVFALAAVLPVALTTSARADEHQGPYVSLSLGPNASSQMTFDQDPVNNFPLTTTTGVGVSAAAGWSLPYHFRTEVSYAYRTNDANQFGKLNATGSLTSQSVLANLFYDIPTGTFATPYVGGGVGWAHVSANNIGAGFFSFNQPDTGGDGLAWQVGAGVAIALNSSVDLTLDYRYFAVPDVTLALAPGLSTKADYDNNTGLIGIRWHFGDLLF